MKRVGGKLRHTCLGREVGLLNVFWGGGGGKKVGGWVGGWEARLYSTYLLLPVGAEYRREREGGGFKRKVGGWVVGMDLPAVVGRMDGPTCCCR